MKHLTLYTFLLLLVVLGLGPLATPAAGQARVDIRVVNLAASHASIDMFLNGSGPAYITNLQFGFASQNARIPVDTSQALNEKFADAGGTIGSAFLSRDVNTDANIAYTTLLYGAGASPKAKVLSRSYVQVPPQSKALIRIVNATTISTPLDFYFAILGGPPAFSAVAQDSATPFVQQDGQPTTLVITQAGVTTSMADLVPGLADGSIVTVIVTGSNASDLRVYQLNEDADKLGEYQLPTLGKAGAQPTVRSVNALPPQQNGGLDSVDVYFGTKLQSRAIGYRGAAATSLPLTDDSVTVNFVTSGHDPSSGSLLSVPLAVMRDTAYSLVLTQFKNGAITPLTLKTSLNSDPIGALGDVKFRVANATDFFGNLTFVVNPGGPNEVRFEEIPFLGVSNWDTIPAGDIRIAVYQTGATMPFYTGTSPIDGGALYTFLAIGDTSKREGDTLRFSVDVLSESLQAKYKRMYTFDGPLAAVPAAIAGARELKLSIAPNPLDGFGSVTFTLPQAGRTTVRLYDNLGRLVGTLLDSWREAGMQAVPIGAEGLPAGAYTCVMQTSNGMRAAQQVLIVR